MNGKKTFFGMTSTQLLIYTGLIVPVFIAFLFTQKSASVQKPAEPVGVVEDLLWGRFGLFQGLGPDHELPDQSNGHEKAMNYISELKTSIPGCRIFQLRGFFIDVNARARKFSLAPENQIHAPQNGPNDASCRSKAQGRADVSLPELPSYSFHFPRDQQADLKVNLWFDYRSLIMVYSAN